MKSNSTTIEEIIVSDSAYTGAIFSSIRGARGIQPDAPTVPTIIGGYFQIGGDGLTHVKKEARVVSVFINKNNPAIPIVTNNSVYYKDFSKIKVADYTDYANGDYLFDTITKSWKLFNGTTWTNALVIMIAEIYMMDDVIYAYKCSELMRNFNRLNNVKFYKGHYTDAKLVTRFSGNINVYGNNIKIPSNTEIT